MPTVNYRELKRQYDLDGPARTVAVLGEAIENKKLRLDDFSIRDLAEALVPDGREWVRSMDPRQSGGSFRVLQEAGEGVDISAFSNITGQLLVSRVLQAYQNEAFVGSRMVSTIPTRLNGEKLPGISRVTDTIKSVQPGMPFESLGFGEEYIETPATTKYGFIVPVTKEAIFFDLTGLIGMRAAEVGEILGINKEKRVLDVITGVVNNYKRNGTSYNTYQTSTPWINVKSGNTLIDWTDVDNVEQLFANITDPNTGEPVLVNARDVLVMPAYLHAANRVFNATEIRYTGSGAATQTLAPNPLSGYRVESSRLARARLVASGVSASDADKYWYVGDFGKAFAYMENWPITVVQAPNNSEAEFTQDIVLRYKASERGTPAVLDPRYVVKSYES